VKTNETATAFLGLTYLVVIPILVVGWIFNVLAIWHTMDGSLTAKLILRCIGVFVFPVGGILGYL